MSVSATYLRSLGNVERHWLSSSELVEIVIIVDDLDNRGI